MAEPDGADGGAERLVRSALADNAELAARLADDALVAAVATVGDVLVAAFAAGAKLVLFGNGGSAADAAHLAAEFVGRCTRDRRALPAVHLGDSSAGLTAMANDYGYRHVFERGVQAFVRPGDVVIGLTTSGRSENVLRGLAEAARLGAVTVALCGADDSGLRPLVEHCVAVPSTSTARVQETHLLWGHIWAELVESGLPSPGRE
ncbi:MAG: SIS domain-containing protein [Sporichthyaceae bacterium]